MQRALFEKKELGVRSCIITYYIQSITSSLTYLLLHNESPHAFLFQHVGWVELVKPNNKA